MFGPRVPLWLARRAAAVLFCLAAHGASAATELDLIGVTALRALVPDLAGAGVAVAQAEARVTSGQMDWQVNPAVVSQPVSRFTWFSSAGITSAFPNALGTESAHADQVGNLFYGGTNGVAPGVARVDNYEAGYFYNSAVRSQSAITAKVINQSFVFGSQDAAVDRDYDGFAARYNVLFVSGAGNSGPVRSPASAYNGLGVGAFGGSSSVGPTADGRSKPDIVAPAVLSSFSTPLVAGAAALLLQAGTRNEGGEGTSGSARDVRTVKALLLNGATKPADWTNGTMRPLDARHGAGLLNVFNSHCLLRGGKHTATASTTNLAGDAHLPPDITTSLGTRRGWDFVSVSSLVSLDAVKHYLFTLNGSSNPTFTFTATLVWHRQANRNEINDLDLFLFNADDDSLVAASQSPVDNVEHIFVRGLPPARYDLQVVKNGGPTKWVTAVETYALAFEFDPPEPPRLADARWTGGQFEARVIGAPRQFYVIQGTSDFATWANLLTNLTSDAGLFGFADLGGTSPDKKFYRAVLAR
jgi:hypothetical protein